MGMVVGGDKAWHVTRHKDIGVAFHWIGESCCMVLWPLHRGLQLGAVPYALPLESAHELVQAGSRGEGIDSNALVEKARTAARLFGAPGDWQMVRTIADAMLQNVDKLCDMPPSPEEFLRRKGDCAGEIVMKVGGETVYEGEA